MNFEVIELRFTKRQFFSSAIVLPKIYFELILKVIYPQFFDMTNPTQSDSPVG